MLFRSGNQTIAQRLFAVREDLIKPTFITATVGYGGTVIGIGMLGVMALYLGIEPMGGDVNNLMPQMVGTYLPVVLVALAFIMIIGSLSSTADSDLAALSSIVMADIYGQSVGRKNVNPKLMLLIGRITMIVATGLALFFATARFNILDLLVFVGALWGCLVFPVIASFYWKKVTNRAFTISVIAALAIFLPVRFTLVPLTGAWGLFVELLAIIGVGVVLGIMAFGFFGLRPAVIVGAVATLVVLPFGFGYLRDFETLTGSLVAYSVSFLVCYLLSVRSSQNFDFSVIRKVTGDFDEETPTAEADEADEGDEDRTAVPTGSDR